MKKTGDLLGSLKDVPSEHVYTPQELAARAMLAALQVASRHLCTKDWRGGMADTINSAIAQAEAAGITTE